jgi:hypothetical protein
VVRSPLSPDDYRAACAEVAKALLAQFEGGLTMRRPRCTEAIAVVGQFTTRALRNYQAVILLCDCGHGVEAQALLRLLLEDLINLRFIATDPMRLSKAWVRQEGRRRYQYHLSEREKDPDRKPPDDIATLRGLYAADARAVRTTPKGRKMSKQQVADAIAKMSWTKLGLRSRARAADASGKYEHTEHGYLQFYPYLCDHTHGSSTLAADYLQDVNGEIHVVPDDQTYKSVTPKVLATWYVHSIQRALGDLGLEHVVDVMEIAKRHADFETPTSDLLR